MPRVLLQSVGKGKGAKHYAETIEKQVTLRRINDYLTLPQRHALSALYRGEEAPIWGVRSWAADLWRQMEPGTLVLFGQEWKVISVGTVTYTVHNPKLAGELWPDEEGDIWEYVYFLRDVEPQDIDYREINKLVGYSPNNAWQRATLLDDEKSARVIDYLGLEPVGQVPTLSQYRQAARELDASRQLDKRRETLVRTEQAFLRGNLFGNKSQADCGICGRRFPVNLLIAAHVKKRAKCPVEEKLDIRNNVIPMCKFGCDDLFERGYIAVVEGKVEARPKASVTAPVAEYVQKIAGRACEYWHQGSAKYFEWHARNSK